MRVEAGDVVIGLASDGVHSNGFSLVRRIVHERRLTLDQPWGDRTLGDELLTPTRIYAPAIVRLLRNYRVKRIVSGMAHITGGGLGGNVRRALPPNVDARLDRRTWEVPAIFRFLQEKGPVEEDEMFRVFNMGIGYVLIVRPTFARAVARRLTRLGERPVEIGRIAKGTGTVVWE